MFVGCPEGCRYYTASAVYDLVFLCSIVCVSVAGLTELFYILHICEKLTPDLEVRWWVGQGEMFRLMGSGQDGLRSVAYSGGPLGHVPFYKKKIPIEKNRKTFVWARVASKNWAPILWNPKRLVGLRWVKVGFYLCSIECWLCCILIVVGCQ